MNYETREVQLQSKVRSDGQFLLFPFFYGNSNEIVSTLSVEETVRTMQKKPRQQASERRFLMALLVTSFETITYGNVVRFLHISGRFPVSEQASISDFPLQSEFFRFPSFKRNFHFVMPEF